MVMPSIKLNKEDKSKGKLLSTITLKFTNKKLEHNFEKRNFVQSKQNNKSLSLVSLIIVALTLIFMISFYIIKSQSTSNLLIEHLTNTTVLSEINNNETSISSEFLFKGNYILINLTKVQTGNFTKEQSLLSPKIQKNADYVTLTIFFYSTITNLSFIIFFYIVIYIFSCVLKKDFHHKILFCLITFFFSQSFHTIAGILHVALHVPAEGIYILLVFQVLVKVIVTYQYNTNWLLFSLGTLLSLIYDWALYNLIVTFDSVMYCYLAATTLVHANCICTSYLNEKKYRFEFSLKTNMRREMKYLEDLLFKLDQGYITYNKNILFLNVTMKKLLTFFIDENSNDYWDDNGKNKYTLGTKEINPNFHRILQSNVKPKCKILINKLLTYITEINQSLPEDLISTFKENNFENNNENNFDKFYERVIEMKNFSNFTSLGVINIPSNGKESNKKYQIIFRVKFCGMKIYSNEQFVEFMLIDVSEVALNEREKAVVSTRSIYLSKIAHEFRNPISSIMELSSGILDEIVEKEVSIVPLILDRTIISHKANYIEKLCRVMSHFLNDYTLLTNLKFSCRDNCSNNLVRCTKCSFKTFCKKCKICDNCIKKNETNFNIIDGVKCINENFRNLCSFERATKPILFIEKFKNKTDLLNNNMHVRIDDEELLKSAIYNIIFNSYKSSICSKGKIKVQINQIYSPCKENVITQVEIQNNSQEINPNFINFLQSDDEFLFDKNTLGIGNKINCSQNIFEVNVQDNNNDIFNKNFEIYVAFFMLKKLGYHLKISSTKLASIFSFSIINKIKDLNLNQHLEANINQLNINNHFDNNLSSNNSSKTEITVLNEALYIINWEDENLNKMFEQRRKIRNNTTNMKPSKNDIGIVKRESIKSLKPNTTKKINLSSIESESNEYITFEISNSNSNLDIVNNDNENDDNIFINNRIIRVLIIDDESMVRGSIKRYFTNINKSNNINFKFDEASNCFEAIQILHTSLIENFYFDIIIIDEYMPNMKGSTLIKLLKGLHSENNFYNVNVISHTAFDTNEKKKFILDSGADFILSKPVLFKDFKDLILKIIC